MPSSIATDLFAVMEKQIGPEAARAAAVSYLANSQGSAVAEKAPRPPMSEEQKAKMKAGREAAIAKKAADKAAGIAEPVKVEQPAEKPKRKSQFDGMSEEEADAKKAEIGARLKAGREAAAAKKVAEKAAGGAESESAPSPPKDQPSPQSDSSAAKKRGPKPLKDMTPEERAAHDAKVSERSAKKAAEKAAKQLLPASPTE
jgi:hypothetical protein